MAASRWRTWDKDYFIDTIDSQLPEEGEIISAVGYGRGKPKKDISSLSLPRAALVNTQDAIGFSRDKNDTNSSIGRGQALKERALLGTAPARRPGLKPPSSMLKIPGFDVPLSATRLPYNVNRNSSKNRKNQDTEWPALGCSDIRKSSPKVKKKEQSESKPLSFAAISKPKKLTRPSVSSVQSESDGSDIVILDNLPPTMTDKELCDLFKEYGDIVTCDIERDREGVSLGSAVVRMEDRQTCEWIVSCFDDTEYAGYRINCRMLDVT